MEYRTIIVLIAFLFLSVSGKAQITIDTLAIHEVRLNQHPILWDYNEFINNSSIDSTSEELWECGNPFEWLDNEFMEKQEMEALIHHHSNNIEFITNGNKILPLHILVGNNKLYIPDKNITFDKNTTLESCMRTFPNIHAGKDEEGNERMDIPFSQYPDEGYWFFTFKNGKLYSVELWWLLC